MYMEIDREVFYRHFFQAYFSFDRLDRKSRVDILEKACGIIVSVDKFYANEALVLIVLSRWRSPVAGAR